jgi:hypothetical protein
MYPRLLFYGEQYVICWDIAEHGELGHAGWQNTPEEGKKYYPRMAQDGFERPVSGVLDFTRPVKKEK